jgi:hypothetical protein
MRCNLLRFTRCFFVFILVTAACSTPSILFDYNTKARFSNYQTFSWLESDTAPLLIETVDQMIRDSISKQLESKGIQNVGSGGDLLATYHPGRKDRIFPSRYGYTYWPARWGYGGYYQGVENYEYDDGALLIDLIDRRTNQLIWRGSAPKVLRIATTEELSREIGEAVRQILVNFPPPEG